MGHIEANANDFNAKKVDQSKIKKKQYNAPLVKLPLEAHQKKENTNLAIELLRD